jgi:hypothetical protein
MGIWGTGPFDNDDAGDMVGKMLDPIQRVLDLPLSRDRSKRSRGRRFRPIASDYYFEARAAAAIIMLAHGTDVLGGPPLEMVLDALKKMRSDEEWLRGWREGRWYGEIKNRSRKPVRTTNLAKALDRQIRAVQRKIRTCCDKIRVKNARRRGRVLRRKT